MIKKALRTAAIACACALGGSALAAPCRNVTFDSVPAFAAGGNITALIAADFNGDGNVDLLVGNGGADSTHGRSPGLKIYLNDGRANFSNSLTVSDSLYVGVAAAIDFNEDGLPDLAVVESNTGTLWLFQNHGSSFTEAGHYPAALGTEAIGDFNGDGHQDIAIHSGSNLLVFIGNGRGAFTSISLPEPAGAKSLVAVADLDGDGRDDLIESAPSTKQLMIRYGDASSVLSDARPTAPFYASPDNVLTGDFDGSGRLDIVAQSNLGTLELLRDPGRSPTGAPALQSYAVSGIGVAGDFTGDGIADIVNHTPFGIVTVGVLASNAKFQSLSPSTFALPVTSGTLIVAADFNGDGKLDVAVTNNIKVGILLNRGDGHFAAPPHVNAAGIRAVLDLNGDGVNDVITDGSVGTGPAANVYPVVWFGNPDGTYRPSTITTPDHQSIVKTVDLDHDGNLDIVIVAYDPVGDGNGHLWIMRGMGGASFQTMDLGTFSHRAKSVAIVDLDGDGRLDIVAGNGFGTSPVSIAYGRGDGTFEAPQDLSIGSYLITGDSMGVADLNGDGLPDIIAGNNFGRFLFINTGHRVFKGEVTSEPLEGPIQLADMNGDGKPDLIDTTPYGVPLKIDINVHLGRGDGTFGPPLATTLAIDRTSSIDVADMNSDGKPDIVINDAGSSSSTDAFYVLLGRGNGYFETPLSWPSIGQLQVIDINGDGRPDIMNGDVVRTNQCLDSPGRRRAVAR